MTGIHVDHPRPLAAAPMQGRRLKRSRASVRIGQVTVRPYTPHTLPGGIPLQALRCKPLPSLGVNYHLHALPSASAFWRWSWLAPCILALLCPMPAAAQESADDGTYVGATVCGSCHRGQFERQSRSGHAQTLHRASDHPLRDRFVPAHPLRRPPRFRYRYQRDAERITVQADDGEYITELALEWAFGAGAHGVTFVSRLNRQSYLEHAFSFYSAADSLDITPGHESIQPESLLQAMGLRYSVRGPGHAISNCFACHSTGPLSYSPSEEVAVNEPGVRCESCHGPGGRHLDAALVGDADLARAAIRNPKQFASDELLQFCGDCHRDPRGASDGFDLEVAWNVRHQPPYFRKSRCFQSGGENLSCFTCHDPHDPVRRNQPDYYRERCMTCHEEEGRVPAETCGVDRPTDCTNCHMPTVAVNSNLKFKNHWIGIYLDGSSLTPAR